ncbi:MAG TPA: alpha/beta hydrolase [Candidatus Eremiobacteraceae bacterium]|nr:alpha/beta hydrolase [Candidatus Eremiobacteraceae bacterium]
MPFFERAGLKLSYFEVGHGPPVLLIHGWGGRARRQWHKTIAALHRHYHFYALELRGHGHSQEVRDPDYDWQDLVDDCEALRSLAGCERWTVVGYSFGGLVGLHYAALYPERVAAVCAVSPMMVPRSFAFVMRHLRLPVAWLLRLARTLPPSLSGKLAHNVAKTRLRTLFHTVDMMHEWEPKTTKIPPSVPVIILIGDHDRSAHGERILGVAPRVEVRILEDTGHFPLWQQRQRFVRELHEILALHARSGA